MGLFGDSSESVPVSIVERFLGALEKERERAHAITLEALAIKRHELAMVPAGWTPPKDPYEALGRRTQAAIEEFAQNDAELRRRLIGSATNLAAALALGDLEGEALDAEVARRIYEGDT